MKDDDKQAIGLTIGLAVGGLAISLGQQFTNPAVAIARTITIAFLEKNSSMWQPNQVRNVICHANILLASIVTLTEK
ncbi:MAG: hypothetical protein ORN57_03880 [Alphaproteobacteria bacterium]|nr:hypothetical protein [Alphaproteobacteria bacterium]